MNANPHFPPTPWAIVNREGLGWFVEDANRRAIAWIHTHDLRAEEAMLPEFRKLVESVNKDHENSNTAKP